MSDIELFKWAIGTLGGNGSLLAILFILNKLGILGAPKPQLGEAEIRALSEMQNAMNEMAQTIMAMSTAHAQAMQAITTSLSNLTTQQATQLEFSKIILEEVRRAA